MSVPHHVLLVMAKTSSNSTAAWLECQRQKTCLHWRLTTEQAKLTSMMAEPAAQCTSSCFLLWLLTERVPQVMQAMARTPAPSYQPPEYNPDRLVLPKTHSKRSSELCKQVT